MNPQQCAILVPVAQQVTPGCEKGLRQLEAMGYPVWRVYGFADVDVARCRIATKALLEGFHELMWIDADIGFEPTAVERLRAHDLDFVAGVYPKKGEPALACQVLPGTGQLVLGQQGGLVELLSVGSGFVYTRRRVYDDIREKLALPLCNNRPGEELIPFYHPMIVPTANSHAYLAEDFAFCHRARQAGHKIMADLSIRLWHIGSYAYSWEDAGSPQVRYGTYQFRLNDAR